MGCTTSRSTWHDEAQMQMKHHLEIEQQLAAAKNSRAIKLLLLGAGECGKSTILKQMKILHKGGFSEQEMDAVRQLIYGNVLDALDKVCKLIALNETPYANKACEMSAKAVGETVAFNRHYECPTPALAAHMALLWADATVVNAFDRYADQYHIPIGAKYFFAHLTRICAPEFQPTAQDALHTRIATNGIVEVDFVIRQLPFRVFDVGGQRSQRRKWIHCFDDVNAIIFISAVSEFDQVLAEDNTTNRLRESISLFRTICNSSLFGFRVSLILFLNKIDLFKTKLERRGGGGIGALFVDYEGGRADYAASLAHIHQAFETTNEYPTKRYIYIHDTCATNTDQVQLVFDSVFSTIMRNNISSSGLAS